MKTLLILIAASVGLAGCTSPPTSNVADSPPEKAGQKKLVEFKSYPEALAAAKASGKPLFLYFGAEWCPPCRQMKAVTFKDADVIARLADFVVCIIDVDDHMDLAKQYKVGPIPTFFLVSADERPISTHVGFLDPEQFIAWLAEGDKR